MGIYIFEYNNIPQIIFLMLINLANEFALFHMLISAQTLKLVENILHTFIIILCSYFQALEDSESGPGAHQHWSFPAARKWLVERQRADGGWGDVASTAAAVAALTPASLAAVRPPHCSDKLLDNRHEPLGEGSWTKKKRLAYLHQILVDTKSSGICKSIGPFEESFIATIIHDKKPLK